MSVSSSMNIDSFFELVIIDLNRLGWTLFLALSVYVFFQRHALRVRRSQSSTLRVTAGGECLLVSPSKQRRSASLPVVSSLSALWEGLQSRSRVFSQIPAEMNLESRAADQTGAAVEQRKEKAANQQEESEIEAECSNTDQINGDQALLLRRVPSSDSGSGGSPKSMRESRFSRGKGRIPAIQLVRSPSASLVDSATLPDVPLPTIGKFKRRGSLLFRSESEDAFVSAMGISSRSGLDEGSDTEEDYLFTPFAQILARLHQVKVNVQELLADHLKETGDLQKREVDKLQQSAKRLSTGITTSEHAAPRQVPPQRVRRRPSVPLLSTASGGQNLAQQTVEELEWCVKQLEQVHSQTTAGGMATDKIRRLMTRELQNFLSSSRAGNQVVEWVSKTYQLDDQNPADQWMGNSPASKPRSLSLFKRLVKPRGSIDEGTVIPRFGVNVDDEGSLETFLGNIHDWNFDSFHLTQLAGGNPLVCICYVVFKSRDLFQSCKITERTAVNYFAAIQANYATTPYHNKTHAADVVQAAHCLLQAPGLEGLFSSLETFTILFAAAIHDVGHLGVNNSFLVQTQHELATLYHDESVQENHHLAVAFRLLLDHDCNILGNLSLDERQLVRKIAVSLVMATDLAKHVQSLANLRTLVETKKVVEEGVLLLDNYVDRVEVMGCLVHCADLSNPSRPQHLAVHWTKCVMEEFYHQGDEERKLGLPVSPMMDRNNPSIERCQVAFIDLICQPLWETWGELVHPACKVMLDQLEENKHYWELRMQPTPTSSTSSVSDDTGAVTRRLTSVGELVNEEIREEGSTALEQSLETSCSPGVDVKQAELKPANRYE